MQRINIKIFSWLLLTFSGGLWFALGLLSGANLGDIVEFFGLLPKVVAGNVVVVTVFVKWAWRWRVFRGWLVHAPDLNGTWIGEIRSDWINEETGGKVDPIPAMLAVKQTFFGISCVMQTGEMRSESYGEGMQIDADRQVKRFSYSYGSNPRVSVRERSNSHDGTAVFDILELGKRKLKGRYWTERKTTGEMEFVYHSAMILEELPSDLSWHPLD